MHKLSLEDLNRVDQSTFADQSKLPIVCVLDNVRSGNNVGSFFRTMDCLALEKLVLTGITPVPPHKEIHKTAIGASDTVPWEYYSTTVEAIQQLKDDGYIVLIIEQTNESIFLDAVAINTNDSYALVFGNEVMGVSDEILSMVDGAVEIQQYGTKHSFNVAVCGGIVLHDFAQSFISNR